MTPATGNTATGTSGGTNARSLQAGTVHTVRPEGYEVPVNLSLTQPMLMGGVPRPFAIVNGTLAAALTLGLQVWWLGIPLGLLMHLSAVWLTKADPYWFDVFKRQVRSPKHMEA